MITSSEIFAELEGRVGQIPDKHLQGDFKHFELILEKDRILADEAILYVTTDDLFASIAQRLSHQKEKTFSFLVSGSEDLSSFRQSPSLIFDQADIPLDQLINCLSFVYSAKSRDSVPANENRFISAFLTDLVDGHISGGEDAIKYLKGSPVTLKQHVSIIVIGSAKEGSALPVRSVGEFSSCFPGSIACYHHDKVLILVQKDLYEEPMVYNSISFANLLEYYDAYAVQGYFTKWATSIRASYLQAEKGIRFIKKYGEKGRRFYDTQNFGYIVKLDLCTKAAKDYLHGDAHHFCNPAALALDEYDTAHGTDYCRMIAAYLDSDRNVSKAADRLFYNKNTLKAKLDRITDILEKNDNATVDLDNPLIRYDFRFSLYLIDYIKTYMNRDTPYSPKERVPSTSEQLQD